MHTFYITGGSSQDRLDYITRVCDDTGIHSYDIHRLIPKEQAQSIGISDIRLWQKELFLTPLSSPYTVGIIPNAELLTTEAQQALLKTLEEPPPHTKIYIESQSSSTLLPTILSRCHVIQRATRSENSMDQQDPIVAVLLQLVNETLSIGKRIAMLDEHISNKDDAKIWVTQAIQTLHSHRKIIPTSTYMHLMKRLMKTSQHLAANVSYKLAIDHIIYPKIH
jgi:DNA polymerase III delta prime subunit